MQISVSILGIKEQKKHNIRKLNKTKIAYLHLDIMDGIYVPNKTDEFSHIKHLVQETNHSLDIHLMVKDIIKYVDIYKHLKPAYLTFHYEATDNPLTMIDYIKNNHFKVGMSINPDTPIELIKEYLDDIDLILVMTVTPGASGQAFMEEVIPKITLLKQLREQYNYHYVIEVDGGINNNTALKCQDADILAIGSYITNDDDYSKKVNIIRALFK